MNRTKNLFCAEDGKVSRLHSLDHLTSNNKNNAEKMRDCVRLS